MADQQKYINKLKDARVLVIGGSSGIGFGVAEALLEYGANVTISSSNPTRVESSIKRLQNSYPSATSRISGHACNLGDHSTLEANLKTLLDTTTSNGQTKLDHVVYTAGDALAIMKLATADMPAVIKAGTVRFFGPLMLGKVAPAYLNPGPASSITLTTGAVSERPIPDWSVINGFMTGLQGMTRGLALDLKPLRVNLVSPGAVETELWDGMGEEGKKAMMAKFAEGMPTGQVGRVEDVVEAYLGVMKDCNCTGSMVSTNGGHLLMG